MNADTIRYIDRYSSQFLLHLGSCAFAGWMARIDMISTLAFAIIEKVVDTAFEYVIPCDRAYVYEQVLIHDPEASEKKKQFVFKAYRFTLRQARSLCTTIFLRVVMHHVSFPKALIANWKLTFYRMLSAQAITQYSGVR